MKTDIDALRARLLHPKLTAEEFESIMALLSCIEERESPTTYTIGETEWAHRIATLEHMLAEERTRVAELEAEVAVLRPWAVMLKRAHGALTDAGCVVPLEFDQSIEHAIKDLANRATRAAQLFVDEYDARRDVERDRDELQARITTLEAMKP